MTFLYDSSRVSAVITKSLSRMLNIHMSLSEYQTRCCVLTGVSRNNKDDFLLHIPPLCKFVLIYYHERVLLVVMTIKTI